MPENFYNIYAWLYVLACFPQGVITGWVFTKCFDVKISRIAAVFVIGTVSFIFVIPQTFFKIYVPYKPYIIYTLFFLTALLLKKRHHSAVKVVIWIAIDIFIDMMLELLIMMMCVYTGFIDFNKGTDFYDLNRIVATLFFTSGSFPVKYLMSVIWKRFILKDSQTKLQPTLILFPVTQFLCIVAITVEHSNTGYLSNANDKHFGMNTSSILVATMFIFAFANFVYLYFISDLEKKYKLENELKIIRYEHELEAKHYQDIVDKRYEIAKIRHDLKNQLLTVKAMINNGELTTANEIISELSNEIENTEENRYSSSPVINALITEKSVLAKNEAISIETDISIPEDNTITPTHLCSIFSNLIDNAIKANLNIANNQKRYISIVAFTKNDTLLIQVKNPVKHSDSNIKLQYRKNGYGMRILNDIAKEYSGSFNAEISDDICICKMLMNYKKSPSA